MGFYIYVSTEKDSSILCFNQSVKVAASVSDVAVHTAAVFVAPCVLVDRCFVSATTIHSTSTLFGLNQNSGWAVFELEMLVPVLLPIQNRDHGIKE